ncbi:hypothetical protein [Saccharopolyspora shandongensis]|uniref:hypothetical protein n=1 Tax=Saccharopolyspora shandongensis TaxID=418495 RepID=UPI0033FD2CE3
MKHGDFAHVKGEGVRHWGPGWQQRMVEDARIRAESLGYHKPDAPHAPEPAPAAPPRSTSESMAAEKPPENPFEHRWNDRVGPGEPVDISPELREKLGGRGLGIRNTDSGLSMIQDLPRSNSNPANAAQRMPRPSVDPKRFTVEVHGSPNGVHFNGKELSAKELAEIIKGAPGYKHGEPVRLLSCQTGADLPDGSPNFAQQLSKELGVEVLAPNKDAWVDNFGNMYASGSRADFDVDASGTPQPRFDEPGQWVSFSPDGTKAVHDSPFPPGHEPEWTRFGHQADAAHQRGVFDWIRGRKSEDSFEFDPVSGENLEARRFDQGLQPPQQAPHPGSHQQQPGFGHQPPPQHPGQYPNQPPPQQGWQYPNQPSAQQGWQNPQQAPQHQYPQQQGWQQPAQQPHTPGGQQQSHLPQGWQRPQAPSPAAPQQNWSQPHGQQAPGHQPQPPQNQWHGQHPGQAQPAFPHQQPAAPAHQQPAQGQLGGQHQSAPQPPGRMHQQPQQGGMHPQQPHAGNTPHGAQQPHSANAPHRSQQPQAMHQQPGYHPAPSPAPHAQRTPGQHQQPAPPARPAGQPPVDVRGPHQNPPAPRQQTPPLDVNGPRMPNQSGPQAPTFGPRTDGGFGPRGSQAFDASASPHQQGSPADGVPPAGHGNGVGGLAQDLAAHPNGPGKPTFSHQPGGPQLEADVRTSAEIQREMALKYSDQHDVSMFEAQRLIDGFELGPDGALRPKVLDRPETLSPRPDAVDFRYLNEVVTHSRAHGDSKEFEGLQKPTFVPGGELPPGLTREVPDECKAGGPDGVDIKKIYALLGPEDEIPVWRREEDWLNPKNALFRMDDRPIDDVLGKDFTTRNPDNLNLSQHAGVTETGDGFVGVTKSPEHAIYRNTVISTRHEMADIAKMGPDELRQLGLRKVPGGWEKTQYMHEFYHPSGVDLDASLRDVGWPNEHQEGEVVFPGGIETGHHYRSWPRVTKFDEDGNIVSMEVREPIYNSAFGPERSKGE